MGNPKFPRKKYDTPSHPWQGDRIKLENDIIKKFGLKNKREVWKAQSLVRKFRQNARALNARLRIGDVQAEKEEEQLLAKLNSWGLLPPNSDLNNVLSMELESVLNKRLQTQVYLKGLANTPKQARQFIVHGHISISGRKVTIPGYLVKHNEESLIEYNDYSSLTNELHPMRPKPKITAAVDDGQVSRLIKIDGTLKESELDQETKTEPDGADNKEESKAPERKEA
jgi:small subunit ribosomal protein S4